MITFPNAKINIGLHILGKRADGFHDLHSVMIPIGWHDSLELIKAPDLDGLKFLQHGFPLGGGVNICQKCYDLFREQFDLGGVEAHLIKNIPAGAGLGGGSSDAAFFAKMLNELFGLGLTVVQLEEMVSQLGADCPFFIQNRPVVVSGKGDEMSPLDLGLKDFWIQVIFPDVFISTAEAYANCTPSGNTMDLERVRTDKILEWAEFLTNDFEKYAFERFPQLKTIRNDFIERGALYASMTGSGSAVYGVFESEPPRVEATNFRVWQGRL